MGVSVGERYDGGWVWRKIAWREVVWRKVVWCEVVWREIVWCKVVWREVVPPLPDILR